MVVDMKGYLLAALVPVLLGPISSWCGQTAWDQGKYDNLYFWLFVVTACASLFALAVAVRYAGVEFGSPEMPARLLCLEVILTIILLVIPGLWALVAGISTNPLVQLSIIPISVPSLWSLLNLRRSAMLFMAIITLLLADPRVGADVHINVGNAWSNFFSGVALATSVHTRYIKDQRLICLSCLPGFLSIIVGTYAYVENWGLAVFCGASSFCLLYMAALFARRKRSFPEPLRECKFIRLGYLVKMLASGKRILRCQELPDDAFGDPTKADVVIILSHRWLHRYTCDLATDEFPEGLRLNSLLKNIVLSLPQAWGDTSADGCNLFRRLPKYVPSLRCGGWDVLFFFDFMGLPQIGQTPTGELIQRTEQEANLFFKALPLMGALYGIFPVLVIPEVVPSVHPYFSSGWCFSEFTTGLLTGTLKEYSNVTLDEYMKNVMDTFANQVSQDTFDSMFGKSWTEASTHEFLIVFEADLATKYFFNESDRGIVRGIVKGYLLKRQLFDAVYCGNGSKSQQLLLEVKKAGLLSSTVNQAIDGSLDTLLHVAVRLNSLETVEALLAHEADPSSRNLCGDLPTQCFMLPRCSQSARACNRHMQAAQMDGYAPVASA